MEIPPAIRGTNNNIKRHPSAIILAMGVLIYNKWMGANWAAIKFLL
jgi:hypothetical protein